jgi:hypothetical protein
MDLLTQETSNCDGPLYANAASTPGLQSCSASSLLAVEAHTALQTRNCHSYSSLSESLWLAINGKRICT